MRLQNGSRVCVVGGGPAGSFAAIHLLEQARARGLDIEVLVFEPRDFSSPGGKNCKGCAGILSAGMATALRSCGLALPEPVVQSDLRAYRVYVNQQVTHIEQPNPQRQILSVYRGRQPRLGCLEPAASFDGYVLAQACARGARHVLARVRSVEWDGRPLVQTGQATFPADLLVLATGVNSRSPLAPAFGYQPPQTAPMAQAELARPDGWPEQTVAGFFGGLPQLVFGAMVPKRHYVSVSLLWRGPTQDAFSLFYKAHAQALQPFFPKPPHNVCQCAPRIVVRPAQTYFGDRWVAVGDAAVSRLYKDGIHSAFLTSRTAMQVAVEQGVARRDFQHAYAPVCQRLALDNRFGELMFELGSRAVRSPALAQAFAHCIRTETGRPFEQRTCSRLVWGMLTGDESYRDLFRLALKPAWMLGLGCELLRARLAAPTGA